MSDEINKGLGFEKYYLNNESKNLTKNEVEVIISLREKIINFMLTISSKILK